MSTPSAATEAAAEDAPQGIAIEPPKCHCVPRFPSIICVSCRIRLAEAAKWKKSKAKAEARAKKAKAEALARKTATVARGDGRGRGPPKTAAREAAGTNGEPETTEAREAKELEVRERAEQEECRVAAGKIRAYFDAMPQVRLPTACQTRPFPAPSHSSRSLRPKAAGSFPACA